MAKRAREADAAAWAVILRRRAIKIARATAREEAHARQLPTVAAGAVMREMVHRAGPALAMGQGEGTVCASRGACGGRA